MATELRQLFREALELTDNDRATLAGLLIESLEGPPDPDCRSSVGSRGRTTLAGN